MAKLKESPLTPADIVGKLDALASDKEAWPIVDDVYELAQKQLANEDTFAARLDARASSLFGAVGFSTTVAVSFGGWALLSNVGQIQNGFLVSIVFLLVLVTGVAAGAFALAGLLLRYSHSGLDIEQVFHSQIIAPGRKQVDFRIHLSADLWSIWQDRRQKSERRAGLIRRGQQCFFLFLSALVLLSGLTTYSAFAK